MLEQLLSLDLPAGFVNNGTAYAAKGRWYTGSLVRFRGKILQPIGGWVARSLSMALPATPTGAISVVDGSGATLTVVGAGSGLFKIVGTVVTNITPAPLGGGSLDPTDPSKWQLERFGKYIIAAYNPSRALFVWDGVAANAVSGTAAPYLMPSGDYVVATPERFLFVLGVAIDGTSIGNLAWASQGSLTDWIASGTNTAGNFTLATVGAFISGRAGRGQTLLWTTVDLWAATYIGGTLVYSFAKVGDFCGAISTYAPVMIDGVAFWMGHGNFFRFDGAVRQIPCDVQDYVFSNFNASRQYRVWGIANPLFSEVTWFYPSSASAECDRYVTYNYGADHWTFGTLARSTGVTAESGSVAQTPVMFDPTGICYDHETGNARSSTPFAESGPIELDNGDKVMRVQRIVPDDKTAGDVTASLYSSMMPDSAETLNGPYTLASPTSVRLTARQVRLRITEAVSAAWRVGMVRLGVIPGGRR